LERIPPEVWDDLLHDQREASNLPLQRSVAAVWPECTAAEVVLDHQEHLAAVTVLADRQARPHLPADSESRAWRARDREASLTVAESGDVRRDVHVALSSRARVLPRP